MLPRFNAAYMPCSSCTFARDIAAEYAQDDSPAQMGLDRHPRAQESCAMPERASRLRSFVGEVPGARSPFPPIADYALLSDCHVAALLAPSGAVEWMCLPRMDGPSIF